MIVVKQVIKIKSHDLTATTNIGSLSLNQINVIGFPCKICKVDYSGLLLEMPNISV